MPFPNLPGVPPLPGSSLFTQAPIILNSLGLGNLFNIAPIWGVFDKNNKPVAVYDSFVSVEFGADARVPSYQIEDGGFSAYNKVETPYRASVVLSCGGDIKKQAAFLTAIDAAKKSLDLYSVVTPYATYKNANITAYNYRREANNGSYLTIVELRIEEIRQVVALYTNVAKSPSSAAPFNGGKVQPQTPNPAQAAKSESFLHMIFN